jgi:hypothetical protein
LKFAEAVFKGIALSALPLAPEASDEELVQIGLSDLVLTEIRRGRGGEILRLVGNITSMLAAVHGDEDEDEGSRLMAAMSNLPGVESSAPVPQERVEVVGSGQSVRELASILKTNEGRFVAPHQQQELFDSPLPGTVILN